MSNKTIDASVSQVTPTKLEKKRFYYVEIQERRTMGYNVFATSEDEAIEKVRDREDLIKEFGPMKDPVELQASAEFMGFLDAGTKGTDAVTEFILKNLEDQLASNEKAIDRWPEWRDHYIALKAQLQLAIIKMKELKRLS